MQASAAQYNFQTLSWQRRAAWVLMAVVAYGSLFPLDWDFDSPNAFGWFKHVGRLDIVKNIVLFVPLGLLVALMARQQAGRRGAFVLRWALGAFVLAAALQVAQVFLPRDPEAADVLTNMIGFALGVLCFAPLHALHRQVHPAGRIRGADPYLLVLALIWLCAAMFPFIPVWRGEMLREQLHEFMRLELDKPRQLVLHAGLTYLGMYVVYHLIEPLPRLGRHAGVAVGFAFLAAVEVKLIGFSHTPSLAALVGMLLGLCGWLAAHRVLRAAPARWLLAAVALALYLVYALMPPNLRSPVFFQWWPFGSLLGGNLSVVLRGYCTEALALGVVLWVVLQQGMRLGLALAAIGALGFACEWMQRYLEYRTPEIGTVVMVLMLGFLRVLCAPVQAPVPRAHGAAVLN